MKPPHPLFASERTAASLFDMKPAEFRKLVDSGCLPPPIDVGNGVKRWDVEHLRMIASGSYALGQELEW